MYSNRRPYYGLKLSIADFFREPVRYLKQSNTQESMMEKPYLTDEYPKMHLKLPDFTFKSKKRHSFLGPIASGIPYGGLAMIDFGDANCWWGITRTSYCIKEPIIITLIADYFFTAEFNFTAQIVKDTMGVTLTQLPGYKAGARDKQDYLLTLPENANGSVTICGFASTHTLISQTFETVVAGMPVGIYLSGGGLVARERGQENPAIVTKSSYGEKGDDCGCISFTSSCDPCVGTTIMTWDDSTSADTIAQSSSVSVAVNDGLGPYSWSVSGVGFTLGSTQTGGGQNTLVSDASACGTATITVTDTCGGSTTGYVRCTTGQWVLKDNTCPIPGPATDGDWTRVEGKDKVIITVAGKWWHNYGDNLDCMTKCGVHAYGCNECITSWTCSDWSAAYVNCKSWECIQAQCASGFYGYCMGVSLMNHYEWEC